MILYNTGHSIQEDDAGNTANNMHDFIIKFRVPTDMDELLNLKTNGIGKFHPEV